MKRYTREHGDGWRWRWMAMATAMDGDGDGWRWRRRWMAMATAMDGDGDDRGRGALLSGNRWISVVNTMKQTVINPRHILAHYHNTTECEGADCPFFAETLPVGESTTLFHYFKQE